MKTLIVSTIIILTGILLFIFGYYLAVHNFTLFSRILDEQLVLSKNSKSYDFWKDTSNLPPIHLDFYFFNWTNPGDLNIPGVKPNFIQVGPYSFLEIKQKVNITFHPENNTVSYFQRRLWYFDQERSNGSLQDTIIQLDAVAVSAAHKMRDWSYFMQNTFNYILTSRTDLSISKTVDELLFTGYEDTIINMGKIIATKEMPPLDRFGWFYTRNGSIKFDGNFNVDTGNEDISQLGVVKKWNYKDTTTFFKSPCNVIEGSAGELWPPYQYEDSISLFSPDVCRTLTYEFEEKIEHMGIVGNKYALGKHSLGNNTKKRYPHHQAKYFEITTTTENFFESDYSGEVTQTYENNDDSDVVNLGNCYCNGECNPSGLINITSCRYGAPAFASLPHFYKGDPMLSNQVEGMNPNEEDHSFYIVLEPTTGIPLEVAARLQINMLIQPSHTISLFTEVPKMYFPMFWFSMKVKAPEEFLSDLKSLLALKDLMLWIGIFLIPIGISMIFLTFIYLFFRRRITHEQLKMETTNSSSNKNSESVYLNKLNPDEDTHVRSNRQLYPKLY
ncbi:hypothetical protein M0802_003338 [Mischocyttarus mexicanus]|nr:hypothetical protein M0802_003338 [Mischocyttarus mexicanus]